MNITELTLEQAKALATKHYNTWGHRVIEGLNVQELTTSLERVDTLGDWVNHWKAVESHSQEIERDIYEPEDDRAWEDDGGIEIDREAYRRMIS
jgi:hypothetical protein